MKILLFVFVIILENSFAQNIYTIQKDAIIYDLPGGDFLTAKHINNKTLLTHIGLTGNVIWEDSLAFQLNIDNTYFCWIAGFKNSDEYIISMMKDLSPNTFPWGGNQNDNDTLIYQFSKLKLSTHQFIAHLIDTFETQGISRPIEFSDNSIILTPLDQSLGISPYINLASFSLAPAMTLNPIAPISSVTIHEAPWSAYKFNDSIYLHQSQEFSHDISKYDSNFNLLQDNYAVITTGEDWNRAFYQNTISYDSIFVFTQGTTGGSPYAEWRMDWRKMDLSEINHTIISSPIIPNTNWNYRTSFDKIAVDKTNRTILVLANEDGANGVDMIQKIFIYDYSFNLLCEMPITIGFKSTNTLVELNNRVYLKTINLTNSELVLVDCQMANTTEVFYQNELLVYPNPTAGKIYVTNNKQATLSITLLSSEGKVINFKQNNNLIVDLDVTEVKNGIYILSIEYEGFKQNKRIIKN